MSFAYVPLNLTGTSSSGSGSGRITVGASGADFTTLSLAIAAGNNVLGVINNVTENAMVSLPSPGLQITIDPGALLNMGSGFFNIGDSSLYIGGNGRLEYDFDILTTTLFDATVNGRLAVNSITIDNNSSVPVCLTNVKYARFSNVIFEGDVSICGDSNIYEGCIYRNSSIFVTPIVDNTMIDGSIFEGVLISDSGVNTVISDSVVY